MSTALRVTSSGPSNLKTFISVTTDIDSSDAAPAAKKHLVDSNGNWTTDDLSYSEIQNVIYEDLGKTVFHDPSAVVGKTPLVDVRKVRPLSTTGNIDIASAFYASMGTRVKDTLGTSAGDIEPAWMALNGSGTFGRL